jgi:hypothetical protein
MAVTASGRGAYGDESPEALRRRADVLLDEMMLGGIDTGAAGPQGSGIATGSGNGNGAAYWPHADEVALDYDGASYGSSPNGNAGEPASEGAPVTHMPFDGEPVLSARTTNSRLISAEERYAQLSAPSQPAEAGATPRRSSPASPLNPGETHSAANDFSASYQSDAVRLESYAGSAAAGAAGSSAVRRQAPSYASQMAVGVRAANRSNLLPRNHEIDADTVQQEINELLRAVSTSLPPGNEAVERSRHLLSKAQTLLESDPTRTAEVDYYLQQVRRIVQRTRQTAQWSALYHKRLNVYLWAWLLLGAMIVAAVALATGDAIAFFNQLFDTPELGLFAQQMPVVLAGAFAGALGASLSALFNMQRRSRREHSYFDRKYGLRGLLLPLLGMFFGTVLALLAAVIFIVAEIDPGIYAWAVAVPTVLALMVGFAQEWMYGARA